MLARELEARGALVETLDVGIARTHFPVGLGYSRTDRQANVLRIGWVVGP